MPSIVNLACDLLGNLFETAVLMCKLHDGISRPHFVAVQQALAALTLCRCRFPSESSVRRLWPEVRGFLATGHSSFVPSSRRSSISSKKRAMTGVATPTWDRDGLDSGLWQCSPFPNSGTACALLPMPGPGNIDESHGNAGEGQSFQQRLERFSVAVFKACRLRETYVHRAVCQFNARVAAVLAGDFTGQVQSATAVILPTISPKPASIKSMGAVIKHPCRQPVRR